MPTMVNAWALAASVLDGTLDEDYPIMTKEEIELKEKAKDYSYYDKDGGLHMKQAKREDFSMSVEGDNYEHSPYYYDWDRNGLTENPFENDYAQAVDHLVDEMPSSFSTLSDNDDQIAHHIFGGLNNEVEKQGEEKPMANYFKYHEDEILKDIEEYVSGTYRGHYTGTTHEYRNVQTIDLMASRDLAADFCQANILKYGSRYGSKDGKSKKDLLKVIHYAMLLLHFDEHYGKPSMTSGNIDHNMP
ncbi:MAG: DUF3310 domain-containing protein [Pseudomonadota bacterium]|nr:DUF3310 domain-containing protein [Pseudomonadota bacterium]